MSGRQGNGYGTGQGYGDSYGYSGSGGYYQDGRDQYNNNGQDQHAYDYSNAYYNGASNGYGQQEYQQYGNQFQQNGYYDYSQQSHDQRADQRTERTRERQDADSYDERGLRSPAAAAAQIQLPPKSATPSERSEGYRGAPPPSYKGNMNVYPDDDKKKLTDDLMKSNSPFHGNDYDDSQPTRFGRIMAVLCCCIPKSTMGRIICGVVTLIVLGGLGIVGYLYIPRFPDIKVLSIEQNHVNAFEFSMDPNYPNNYNKMTIKMSLNMQVSVYNPNAYDMNVDLIDLSAYLMVNSSALKAQAISPATLGLSSIIGPAPSNPDADYSPSYTPKIGTSNTTNVVFYSKKNVTFPMQFVLTYTPDPEVGLIKDPAFAEVINVCGILGTARPALINYNAKSVVAILKNLGYNPIVSGSLKIICPASKSQISALEDAVKGGTDLLTALQDAFSGDSSSSSSSDSQTQASSLSNKLGSSLVQSSSSTNLLVPEEQSHVLADWETVPSNYSALFFST
ncbi:hypothetical protein DFJ73DRAFT_793195 [Zopfochytrium polystomum]|nr:hypothetical protein DFJ73DRAFT_793195 [Zopfochytrium polystomum]